jgi:hypothetical protein
VVATKGGTCSRWNARKLTRYEKSFAAKGKIVFISEREILFFGTQSKQINKHK